MARRCDLIGAKVLTKRLVVRDHVKSTHERQGLGRPPGHSAPHKTPAHRSSSSQPP
jgi:hypothetical protein